VYGVYESTTSVLGNKTMLVVNASEIFLLHIGQKQKSENKKHEEAVINNVSVMSTIHCSHTQTFLSRVYIWM